MSVSHTFVWSIAESLRGPYKRHEYGPVILPFTILRRLECVLDPHRDEINKIVDEQEAEYLRAALIRQKTGLRFYNTSAWTLTSILGDPDNMAANLRDYTKKFSENIDVFERYKFEEEIARLDESERLGTMLRKFSVLDLHPESVPNAEMGDLFEHLIYMDFEATNAAGGDYYTPRDAISLLVDLLFAQDSDALVGSVTRRIYDPTVGTGGMLSVAEEHVRGLNPDAELLLYGQDVNPHSYAMCKSDLLARGQDASNVRLGDTLVDDKFQNATFDYCLANPPYGVDWKEGQRKIVEEHEKKKKGRFAPGLPPVNDGALLFAMHMVSKMRPVDENGVGGRAGIVLSGSPLFNGGAESGQSKIRQWLLENDFVEAIVGLPSDEFYNTDINTYIWILDNAKHLDRKGKVQLIDARGFGKKMRRALGKKRIEITEENRSDIVGAYVDFAETPISKIFEYRDFAYWEATVERPLRLNFECSPERLDRVRESEDLQLIPGLMAALESFGGAHYKNRETFKADLGKHLASTGVWLGASQWAALLWPKAKGSPRILGERDRLAEICYFQSGKQKGQPEPDPLLSDTELVPFGWGGNPKANEAAVATVGEFFEAEVKPHVPDAWIDHSKTRVGYEIPFGRHFYSFEPPRQLAEIDADLEKVVGEIMTLLREVES